MAAAVIWWRARAGGSFYIVGMEGAWSARLGPLLPAICGGISAALALSIVDAAAGPVAGVAAALMVVVLPGFIPLHSASLIGPPLLTLMLATLAVMLHAPRFSLAYGTLAAIVAVYVAPAGIGLPAAAVGWAYLSGSRGARSPIRRVAFALVPLLLLLALSHWTGNGWPLAGSVLWRGGLDRMFRAAGSIIGDQLAPGIDNPTLRWLVIADISLLLIALVMVAWRRVARQRPEGAFLRRLFPAAGVIALAYAAGLAAHSLLLTGAAAPDLAAVFPLVVVALLVVVASIGVLWPRWPRAGKLVALVLILGWAQAAIRG
ncbi:MAG: hypothetical protein ABIZ70_04355 [Gemmatimonadales bacterium]